MANGRLSELGKTIALEGEREKDIVEKAAELAESLYPREGATGRKPAEHFLETAKMLAELKLGAEVIVAGLLHDAVFDGKLSLEEVEAKFGKAAAEILGDFIKLKKLVLKTGERAELENARKMFLAMSKDIKTIILALVERADEIRHMEAFSPESKAKIANESLEIYAPVAHKLGMNKIRDIIEDESFKCLKPAEFSRISKMLKKAVNAREAEIGSITETLKSKLAEKGIKVEIYGRVKHAYSVYRKMHERGIKFNDIRDIIALRIITGSARECYEALGIVHSLWKPLPGCFDDYIAKPKPNMYQSLHTTVIGPDNKPLELQIRTEQMHKIAEDGIAAHWKYKGEGFSGSYDKKLVWMKELFEWQRNEKDAKKIDALKIDFFENNIFVFTPKGEVVELPEGATPIDFAYAIHGDIGERCDKAKANGKLVALAHPLESGDVVEILTVQDTKVKRQWLGFVKTSKAKDKIRQFLKIKSVEQKKPKKKIGRGILIKNSNDKKIRFGKCCNPLPGDDVVGYMTTKRKVSVHRAECENSKRIAKQNKAVDVNWSGSKGEFSAVFAVEARESPGFLPELLKLMAALKVGIESTDAKAFGKGKTRCVFSIKVRNPAELESVIKKIGKLGSVERAYRL